MPGLSKFGLSRSGSMRAAEYQATTAPSTPVTIKVPYWAGTLEEYQAAQVVTSPSRSFSQRIGRKPVAASKVITTPTPAQAIPRKPVPTTPTTLAQAYSYEPTAGNPYVDPVIQHWQDQEATTRSRTAQRASDAPYKRSSSPPYVPKEVRNLEQPRPLSPGSIFANGGTPPAPPATRKASLAISRGIGSLRRATSTVKKAINPQHKLKISSPIAGTIHLDIPVGHVLEPTEHVAPLDLVWLEAAHDDVPRFGQADITIATAREAAKSAESARVSSARADAYKRLTGEQARAATSRVASPAPSATSRVSPKKAPRRVVESTFGGVMDAGMDSSWVPNPRAGLDMPPPPPSQNNAWWNKRGKVSTSAAPTDDAMPTDSNLAHHNPFAALTPAALMFQKNQSKVNQPLPQTQTSVAAPRPTQSARASTAALAPRPLQPMTPAPTKVPLQVPRPASLAYGFDATLGQCNSSHMPTVTCTQCGKGVYAAAVTTHRCGKNVARRGPGPPQESYQTGFPAGREEDDRSEVFVDTYVSAAQTSWRAIRRQ